MDHHQLSTPQLTEVEATFQGQTNSRARHGWRVLQLKQSPTHSTHKHSYKSIIAHLIKIAIDPYAINHLKPGV